MADQKVFNRYEKKYFLNHYTLYPKRYIAYDRIAMPLWFARLLSKHEIYDTSFSKYGNFYKKQLLNERQAL